MEYINDKQIVHALSDAVWNFSRTCRDFPYLFHQSEIADKGSNSKGMA